LTITYTFDKLDRMTARASAAVTESFSYDEGNAQPRTFTRDVDGRLTQLFSVGAHNVALACNTTDTIAAMTDSLWPVQNSSFGYDLNDRVSAVTRSGDNQSFTWDLAGNRTAHARAEAAALLPVPRRDGCRYGVDVLHASHGRFV